MNIFASQALNLYAAYALHILLAWESGHVIASKIQSSIPLKILPLDSASLFWTIFVTVLVLKSASHNATMKNYTGIIISGINIRKHYLVMFHYHDEIQIDLQLSFLSLYFWKHKLWHSDLDRYISSFHMACYCAFVCEIQVNEGIALKQIIDMEACAEWVQDQIQHPVKMTPAQVITVFVRAFPPSTPASDNVQALDVDGGSAYKLYIIIFSVVAVLMIPLCYLLYLRVRYRQNWLVFLQWRTTHSIPWIRWRYAPQRIRDQMRGKLQRKTDPLRTVQSSKSSFITSTTDSVTFVTQKMSDKQMLAAMYPSDVLVGGHKGNPSAAALENLSTKYWV